MSWAAREVSATAVALLYALTAVAASADDTIARATLPNETAIDHTALTEHERVRAELWGLADDEWRRYQTLMAGIRGSISPDTISPIEVLGIHARDAAERRKYAEQWVMMMREDAERILAFQRAYDEAGRRLFPDEVLIDVARLPEPDDQALTPSDRLLLFSRPGCEVCDTLLARILAKLDQIAGLDVYLAGVEPGNEDAIRSWANERGVRPEWVQARRVTLNFNAGALERVAPGRQDLPVLMRRRDEALTPLSEADL